MTIKECLKKNGLQIEVESLKIWQSVDVDFLNSDGREDETQFDLRGSGTKAGNKELESLFKDFCKENGFPRNTVQSITVVQSAYSLNELRDAEV